MKQSTETFPDVSKSYALYERAGELIPGHVQLISRRASRFANGVSPVYAVSAKGARFVDVDGNEYIDWVNAVTAVILGHADEVVDSAVKEQIDRGSIYTLNSPLEVELAEPDAGIASGQHAVFYDGDTCLGGGVMERG